MKSNTISGVLPVSFTVFNFTCFSTILPKIVLAMAETHPCISYGSNSDGFLTWVIAVASLLSDVSWCTKSVGFYNQVTAASLVFYNLVHIWFLPSVLWRCWLGGRKVLAWLSVCNEVQTCMWPSWCHCHSLSLASVKSRLVLPFWYQPAQVVLEKGR